MMGKQTIAKNADDNLQISIVLVNNDFLVIDKPQGLPSAPLAENDIHNAFAQAALKYPSIGAVRGKKMIEGGLIHRIDTETRGLLLIACSQIAYDNFQNQQRNGQFIKYYTAICEDRHSDHEQRAANKQSILFTIESRFRPFGKGRKQVEAVFEGAGRAALQKAGEKIYRTDIVSIEPFTLGCIDGNVQKNASTTSQTVKVLCRIGEGYRHQVRSHLASANLPVVGDLLYGTQFLQKGLKQTNANDHDNELHNGNRMLFFASSLEFDHPVTGKRIIADMKLIQFLTRPLKKIL